MEFTHKVLVSILFVILLAVLVSAVAPRPELIIVNNADTAIDLYVDNNLLTTVQPQMISSPIATSTKGLLTVYSEGTLAPELFSNELKLKRVNTYSIIYYEANEATILENDKNVRKGYAKIRFVHADPEIQSVDVIIGNEIAWESLNYKTIGEYKEIPAGNKDIIIRDRSTLLNTAYFPQEMIEDGEVFTIYLQKNGNVAMNHE